MKPLFILAFFLLAQVVGGQTTWTVRNSGTSERLRSVAFGNGVFVAVDGRPLRSVDGITWTRPAWAGAGQIQRVCFAAGRFIAFGIDYTTFTDYLWVSADGVTATRYSTAPWGAGYSGFQFLQDSAYLKGSLLLAGFDNTQEFGSIPRLMKMEAGGTALIPVMTVPASERPEWLIQTNGEFLAGFFSGIFASADGDTWSLRSTQNWGRPFSVNGMLYAFEKTSADRGATWVDAPKANEPYTRASAPTITAAGHLVCASSLGFDPSGIHTSTNGLTWNRRSSGTTEAMYALAFGNNLFVAVGEGGRISTSPAVNALPALQAPHLEWGMDRMLRWQSVEGRWYYPQSSSDLKTWSALGDPQAGTGSEIFQEAATSGERKFFRVSVR